MNDIIYLYPTSSCDLDNCKTKYPIPNGIKSNLSVLGCHPSQYFDCYGRVELKKSINPTDKEGIYDINPQAYTNKLAQGFDAVKCPCGPVAPTCPDIIYMSRDPRQFDIARADYIPLDTIPIDGDVKLKNIYDKKYDNYGIGFTPYNKIEDGQIVYYIDKSIEDPFYKPVFSEPAQETTVLYQDPMSSMKPEYTRTPLINTENPTTQERKDYPYKLSFLQDTQSYREDIMSYQQRKNNQQRWNARWSNLNY